MPFWGQLPNSRASAPTEWIRMRNTACCARGSVPAETRPAGYGLLHKSNAAANSALHQESGDAGLQSVSFRRMRSGIRP
jgi:hypothetical protein